MIFEDDETLRMYVEESLEHLADIENDLLAIEEAGADIDENLVNNVFRAAHSIKGGAGFMGLTNIKELSHKVENVLGMIRSREIVPEPEIVSILLKAFDALRDLINDIEHSDEVDVSEHIIALVGLTTASLPEDLKGSVSNQLTIHLPNGKAVLQATQFDLDQARKDGKYIYLVEYDLIHDIQRRRKTPLEVITTLSNSGTIIQSKIDIDAVGTLETDIPSRIPFYILFASIIEPEIIPTLFEVDECYCHSITEEMEKAELEKKEAPESPDAPPPEEPANDAPVQEEQPESTEAHMDSEPPPNGDVADMPVPETDMETAHAPSSEVEDSERRAAVEAAQGASKSVAAAAQTSLRVNVSLLDSLMTLAGELVLSRNQLLQAITADNTRALEIAGQRIDMVTSELQEAIMRTRMQSIANVFNKFPRVVRDLARELSKEVDLSIEGKSVELDKTIIEAISDPLTHLVRNAVDHGIETPDIRHNRGKDPVGKVRLSAYHEAGQVNIEISDDGQGLDGEKLALSAVKKGLISEQHVSLMSEKEKMSLIFLPGFSTAKRVTDISGRGVGMDVVKTNLDRLGGIIDIDSRVGEGTVIRIKLPLTLAIIPSQIISIGKERYAIPQVNLNELLRIPALQVRDRIEKVGDAEVVRLRGNLLPLLNLAKVLEIEQRYIDPSDGAVKSERRTNVADRRSKSTPTFKPETAEDVAEESVEPETPSKEYMPRREKDRRTNINSAINIAVVSAGTFKYGLIVDQLRDSEEIVVKPLGRHLKGCNGYAGATIMGDGKVALILDVSGLAQMAELTSLEGADRVAEAALETAKAQKAAKDRASLLLFRNGEDEQCAVPLGMVERIERINVPDIEEVGGKKVVQYRGGSLPLFALNEVADVKPLPEVSQLEVVVFKLTGREVGLMVMPPVDAMDVAVAIDSVTLKQPGIMGSAIIAGHTTLMVDMFEVVRIKNPHWFAGEASDGENLRLDQEARATILFAEDSAFFRNQVKGFLEEDGYRVIEAEDGEEAWRKLQQHGELINLVLTDLEMPNLDGFALTAKIKGDEKYTHLKVVALTSLAGDEDMAKGSRVGIDDYQIKLDRDKLLETVNKHLLT